MLTLKLGKVCSVLRGRPGPSGRWLLCRCHSERPLPSWLGLPSRLRVRVPNPGGTDALARRRGSLPREGKVGLGRTVRARQREACRETTVGRAAVALWPGGPEEPLLSTEDLRPGPSGAPGSTLLCHASPRGIAGFSVGTVGEEACGQRAGLGRPVLCRKTIASVR